jgi:ClpP class serine protease
MKFERIANALYRQPLFITSAGFEILDTVFRKHGADVNSFTEKIKSESGTDFFGNPYPEFEILGNAGIIPIRGPLIQHGSLLEKSCGVMSYDDIRGMMNEAVEAYDAGKCEQIIFDIDSPGGEHVGCLELAREIAMLQEQDYPVHAWCERQMASAAYMLAAGCVSIGMTESAMGGSIGSMIGFLDTSEAMAQQGVKAEIIASGKYKSTGHEGTSLSDEQREYLQGLVDQCAAQFYEHVNDWRPQVDSESMQGQQFLGSDMVEKGLADVLSPSMDDFINGF